MTFNKTYEVRVKDITELLDKLESFETKMESLMGSFPHYHYSIELDEIDDEYAATINIRKDEPENVSVT